MSDEVVDAEIVERCVCSCCSEFVAITAGNCCAGCTRDCVLNLRGEASWRSIASRELIHTLSDRERETLHERIVHGVGMPTPPEKELVGSSMRLAAGEFAKAMRSVRRAAVSKYGAVPVNLASAAVSAGVALGVAHAVRKSRER